jgi:hypothetical protein
MIKDLGRIELIIHKFLSHDVQIFCTNNSEQNNKDLIKNWMSSWEIQELGLYEFSDFKNNRNIYRKNIILSVEIIITTLGLVIIGLMYTKQI